MKYPGYQTIKYYSKTIILIVLKYGLRDAIKFVSDYRIIKNLIREKILSIVPKYKVDNPGASYKKYLDISYWLFESMRRFYFLGLHRGQKLRILDIGTGAGYFPFICSYYGHEAEGLDVPDNEMYNELINALGIKRYGQKIDGFKKIDVDNKYDLITAYMICFNNHKKSNLWHVSEWDFFLSNLFENNLQQDGKIILSFNYETKEEPIDKELLAYFDANNAKREHLSFTLTYEGYLNSNKEP